MSHAGRDVSRTMETGSCEAQHHLNSLPTPNWPSGRTMDARRGWHCRSESCRIRLGEIASDGSLALIVRAESVSRSGVVSVPCPRCGRVKRWFPTGHVAGAPGSE